MKKCLFYLVVLCGSLTLFAQNNLTFIEANEAYNKGDYSKASKLYENIIKTGNHSANLYFNLANSYYKLQKIGPSVYHYEKALALDPNNEDIQVNYGYAKQTLIDDIQPLAKGFLSRFYENLVSKNSDFWAWLSVIGVFIFVIGFLLFYKSYDPNQRKIYFSIWSLAIIIAIASCILAFASDHYQKNTTYAIVYALEVKIQSEPNLRSEQLFTLHEGTKVKLLEAVENWNKIQLANGKIGWVPQQEIKAL